MRSELLPAPDSLALELSQLVRTAQAEDRLPSVSATVFRGGEVVWAEAVGLADVEAGQEATPETQYRVASITKTFTAAAVMQLRDAGALELDDPLSRHLAGTAHGDMTLRRLLSHLSGLQREPVGEVWESLEFPTADELLERLRESEQVLGAGERWHYSNLAYALLGQVVARAAGMPAERYIDERLLKPLDLRRTTWSPSAPAARGYFVDPYADAVRPEPEVELEAKRPAGGLWSTTRDLARWASFLVEPDPAVLAATSAEEMREVQVMAETERWELAWGLGIELFRRGERIFIGHTGALPGHRSIVACFPRGRVGAALLTNASAWPKLTEVGLALAVKAAELLPAEQDPWRPAESPPAPLAGLLGRWWSESSEVVFSYRNGRLEARTPDSPDGQPSVFESDGSGDFRTVSGPERGERLRVVRDAGGEPVKLYWATYPLVRKPAPSGVFPANSHAS